MLKLHLPLFVYADSGQQIQSSTPSPSKYFFFQISLELCGFFMFLSGFSRSRNSFSRSPTFNKHVRFTLFTLFASSGSHRHTSLQNPLPEAMAIILHCIHFLPILISPSHPCHSQLPPPKISLPRPRPVLFAASTAAPAASSRWTTASWPCSAAQCSDVQPRGAHRGDRRWRSSKLHGEVFFPIRNDAKVMKKIFVGLATGLGSTGKPALTSHSSLMPEDAHYQLPVNYQSNINLLSMHWPKNLGLQVYQTVTVLKNLPHNTAITGFWQIMRRFVLPRKSIHTKLSDSQVI